MRTTTHRLTSAALLLAVLGALTGCGDNAAEPAPETAVDEPPIEVSADGVIVSCGGEESWPASVMADGVPGLLEESEARATFRRILDDPALAEEASLSLFPDGIDVVYRVLRGDQKSLTLGLGRWTDRGPAHDSLTLGLEREGDHWVTAGWGQCLHLSPVLRQDLEWVDVTHHSLASAGSRTVNLSGNERQCTGSRDPEPFLQEPVVVENDDAVTVYWTTTPVQGEATCPGNPTVDHKIRLDAPLGSRTLLDGSRYPPRPVPARDGR